MSVPDLAGWTVGVTAARRREELGGALERRGARIVYGSAIRIVPLADDTLLRTATEQCLTAPVDLTVATTGVGFRGWLDAAAGWGLGERLTATLGASTILARGPKVRGAVRAGGLREAWSPDSESSTEVLAHLLAHHDLDGRRIAVQLHGDPLRELVDTLRGKGADVIEVPVYRWEQPEDLAPLHRLVDAVVGGGIDALTFTSAPAAVNFLRTADERGRDVRTALRGPVLCAAVGPVTAAPLLAANLPVCQPERFRLGALVREVAERLPPRATVLTAAGRRLELRGHAAVVDDTLVTLSAAAMALLRALAVQPGRVLSREELVAALPGGTVDARDIEATIARLRTALGDPAIVAPVGEQGYRLAA